MKTLSLFILVLFGCVSVYAQSLSITSISEVKPLKRGTSYNVYMSGGNETDIVKLELLNENSTKVFGQWEESISKGTVTIELPVKTKPAPGYYLQIKNTNNETITTSHPFKIRRKTPLALKFLGIGIVSAGTILILNQDDDAYLSDTHFPVLD